MDVSNFVAILKDCKIEGNKIVTGKQGIHNLLASLKNTYSYDMLKQITAIDNADDGIEIIYHLYSAINEEDLLIATKVHNAEATTVVDLFESARADENEIYDMFGINFLGNEDLKRLYMPESWEGFPLRKDYIQDDTRLAWNDNNDF